MPLLSIVTRTFNGRPEGLARCQESVRSLRHACEVQHYLAVDDQQRGVGWSHLNLKTISPNLTGDYVMLLDDDDYLVDNQLLISLASLALDHPDVVITKMDMGDRVLPPESDWGGRPGPSYIAASCPIVKRSVWLEHVGFFTDEYEGDYRFISSIFDCPRQHKIAWLNHVVSRVGRVSHGAAE